MARKLTKLQLDDIFNIIENWFVKHRLSICPQNVSHELDLATIDLKRMLCSEEEYGKLKDDPHNQGKLTKQQVDEICFIIGDWYLKHKNTFCPPGTEHRLGRAKEDLKEIICSEEEYYTLEDEYTK